MSRMVRTWNLHHRYHSSAGCQLVVKPAYSECRQESLVQGYLVLFSHHLLMSSGSLGLRFLAFRSTREAQWSLDFTD